MSKNAKQHKTDAFVIPLTETHAEPSDQIEMSEDDLKKFRGVYPLFKAIAAALGKRLGPPLLCGSEVRLEVRPDEKELSYNLAELVDDLRNTAAQLADQLGVSVEDLIGTPARSTTGKRGPGRS